MENLLSFEQVFVKLEEIGEREAARCMRIGVEKFPTYCLKFANERLAELERKQYLAKKQTERLKEIKDDPCFIPDAKDLQDRINSFKELRIKNTLTELFTETELSSFLAYWNRMVKEANSNKKYFREACSEGIYNNSYGTIQLALLARDRSRKLNNWKRHKKERHIEAEKRFKAFIIDFTHEAYLAEKERLYREKSEQKTKDRIAKLRDKVKLYYSEKIPLFADQVLPKREEEFSYKYGINSFKRINF